ncbi:MAG: hypothetical protein QXP77_01415 [Candidatus Aenigmatarchaeota archaeon]
MQVFIPSWFYGFDSLIYFIGSMIGFLLNYYFHKIHSLSLEKKHMYLGLGFMLLSTGLLILSITDAYSYFVFKNCRTACTLGLVDKVFSVEDFSYFVYFGLSIFAYTLFIFTYEYENIKFLKFFLLLFFVYLALILILLPKAENYGLWYSYVGYYNLISLLMLIFVSFKSFVNYNETKTLSSLLVMSGFIFISLFHIFYLFSFTNELMYVLSHMFLLIGFSTFLMMVLRVTRK